VASISQKIKKIDYAIYHDPSLLKALLNDCSIKKGLLYSRLGRVLPHRVGIEFELLGDLAKNYVKLHPEIKSEKQFAKHFNVYKYSEDTLGTGYTSNEVPFISLPNSLNEIRVSLIHPLQLFGLYRILIEMKRYCENPIGGGIHIHVDFSKYSSEHNNKVAAGYIRNHLHEVEAIFPKYTGNYNKRKVGIQRKGTYVNFSRYNSIEFRIAPLTFDYETLLTWIVGCNKFVSKVITECHLKPRSKCDSHYNELPIYINTVNHSIESDQSDLDNSISSINELYNRWTVVNSVLTNSLDYSGQTSYSSYSWNDLITSGA
jgi:hypothetical protein